MKAGDTLEVEITGIGTLRARIVTRSENRLLPARTPTPSS